MPPWTLTLPTSDPSVPGRCRLVRVSMLIFSSARNVCYDCTSLPSVPVFNKTFHSIYSGYTHMGGSSGKQWSVNSHWQSNKNSISVWWGMHAFISYLGPGGALVGWEMGCVQGLQCDWCFVVIVHVVLVVFVLVALIGVIWAETWNNGVNTFNAVFCCMILACCMILTGSRSRRHGAISACAKGGWKIRSWNFRNFPAVVRVCVCAQLWSGAALGPLDDGTFHSCMGDVAVQWSGAALGPLDDGTPHSCDADIAEQLWSGAALGPLDDGARSGNSHWACSARCSMPEWKRTPWLAIWRGSLAKSGNSHWACSARCSIPEWKRTPSLAKWRGLPARSGNFETWHDPRVATRYSCFLPLASPVSDGIREGGGGHEIENVFRDFEDFEGFEVFVDFECGLSADLCDFRASEVLCENLPSPLSAADAHKDTKTFGRETGEDPTDTDNAGTRHIPEDAAGLPLPAVNQIEIHPLCTQTD